jgi:MFS transporter, DHA2 family, multidrug resistance protein
LQGFGFGLAFTPMTVLAFATLPAGQITEASGVFTLVRNFGSSLFISVSIALLVRSTAADYARMVKFINLFNGTLKGPRMPAAWNIGTTSGLIRLTDEVQRQASMIGYINAFYLIALTAAVAAPLVWLMRNRPVEQQLDQLSGGRVGEGATQRA